MSCIYKHGVWENGWCNVAYTYCTFWQESICEYDNKTFDMLTVRKNFEIEDSIVNKFQEYCLSKKTDELKKLIAEQPDLPIVVLVGDEANNGDYSWIFCSDISFSIEEILDCDYLDYDDCLFVDRDRLEEVVQDRLSDYYNDDTEFEVAVNAKLEELEPYWTKVIAIYANN